MTVDVPLGGNRRERIGVDEALVCAGKSVAQIEIIVDGIRADANGLLLTRLEPATFARLPARLQTTIDYDPVSRTAILGQPRAIGDQPPVAILLAGTGDMPMAREAARTFAFHGQAYREFVDLGISGLWRLLERLDDIRECPVVIVAAGMDAALISVVGGLVSSPVIALPTSVGDGVATGGTTALHAALASSAPGIVVMNIDNGYGAACAALRIMNALRRDWTASGAGRSDRTALIKW